MPNVLGQVGEVVDQIGDQVTNRQPQQPDPVQFLKDWVVNELPERIVDLAVFTAGDSSALPTKKALEAGADPEFGGPIGKAVREQASKILPGL